MKVCSKETEVRRCRPLLGTFVEITARGLPSARLHTAIDTAFAAIERVQARMSFHVETSDITRLNRLAVRRAVTVDEWTFTVLADACRIAQLSGGAFDITVAPTLVSWGLLPRPPGRRWNRAASWEDIELLPNNRVRFRRALAVDLGGIAKGFAVDQAVAALQTAGAQAGLVNAGGDLRVFGEVARKIHIRHPAHPGLLLPYFNLRDEAVATSSPGFSRHPWRGRIVSHLVHAATRTPHLAPVSVSVRAPRCALADALTKVVLAAEPLAEPVLAAFGAHALVLATEEMKISELAA